MSPQDNKIQQPLESTVKVKIMVLQVSGEGSDKDSKLVKERGLRLKLLQSSKDDIKFYALAAGPLVNGTRRAAFRMPTTFQVEDHEAYFHQVIVPRLLRTQDRLLCKQVNQELDSIGRGKKSTR